MVYSSKKLDQDGCGTEKEAQSRMNVLQREAQSNRMCYSDMKMDGAGRMAMKDKCSRK